MQQINKATTAVGKRTRMPAHSIVRCAINNSIATQRFTLAMQAVLWLNINKFRTYILLNCTTPLDSECLWKSPHWHLPLLQMKMHRFHRRHSLQQTTWPWSVKEHYLWQTIFYIALLTSSTIVRNNTRPMRWMHSLKLKVTFNRWWSGIVESHSQQINDAVWIRW